MKKPDPANRTGSVVAVLAVLAMAGAMVYAADAAPADKPFKPEELEQMLAPIALYPDSLLSQMLMASTYPLEVVQADRWGKQNKDIKGDALTRELEAQSWDASVKSLVNFPPVLAMMSEKLDVTVKIGDAFIGQQKDVMATIQELRGKAQETGNLKTTPEQTVVVDKQVIVIEAADPQVVYIPTYSPTVYYATWPYPAYPPVSYYPPGYVAGRAIAFGAGVAVGAAWGYAWGHSDWHGGSVDIDVNRNASINTNINRSNYQANNASFKNGQGSFQHDAAHRQGVAYRDQKTASQFGRTSPADAAKARESFRGRSGTGAQDLTRGSVAGGRVSAAANQRPTTPNRPNAFDGVNRGGATARTESVRGSSSRSASLSRSSPSRSAAPSRSSGGGSRSGGRR